MGSGGFARVGHIARPLGRRLTLGRVICAPPWTPALHWVLGDLQGLVLCFVTLHWVLGVLPGDLD
jgi:hypothetical protein